METVIIALGSNVGKRRQHLSDGRQFLESLSEGDFDQSAIYISEAVGPSTRPFLNSVVKMQTTREPLELLDQLKQFETEHGRDPDAPRWSARTIDLDIIDYGHQFLEDERLRLPHPEYQKRLFVLLPLREVAPGWEDPSDGRSVDELIENAPELIIHRTELDW